MPLSLCHRPKRHAGAPHRGVNRIHQPASNDSQPSVRRLRGTSGRCARPLKASRCRTPRVHLICYLNGGTKRRRRRWFLGTPRVNCCKTPPYGRRASNCLSLTFSDPTTRQRLAGPFSKRAASIRDQSLLESTLRRGRRRWAPAPPGWRRRVSVHASSRRAASDDLDASAERLQDHHVTDDKLRFSAFGVCARATSRARAWRGVVMACSTCQQRDKHREYGKFSDGPVLAPTSETADRATQACPDATAIVNERV